MFGVWVGPGAFETLQKGGGLRPPLFARVSGAPGAAQIPKITDLQSLFFLELLNQAKVQPRIGVQTRLVIVGLFSRALRETPTSQ
jgi:hypothetical protein